MGFPKKISQLPAAGTLKNSDIFVLVNQHDITSQTTFGNLSASLSGSSWTLQSVLEAGSVGAVPTLIDIRSTGANHFFIEAGNDLNLWGQNDVIINGAGGDTMVQAQDNVYLSTAAIAGTINLSSGNIILDPGAGGKTIGDVLAAKDTEGRIEWVAPPVYQTTKELSNADISTLNSVPVILIDPPGAGKFIQVNSVIVELTYGGAPITGEDNVRLYTVSASTFLSGTEERMGSVAGFLGYGGDYREYVHITGDGFVRENSPLITTSGDAGDPDPTMGGSTSTVKFYINYSIITI